MLNRINNRPFTLPRAGWFLTQKIYCRLSYPFHSRNCGYGYSAKKKPESVFIDLTAANDTLYVTATSSAKLFEHGHHIRNCNCTFLIDTGPQKRLRRLRNGVTWGIILAVLLFNI